MALLHAITLQLVLVIFPPKVVAQHCNQGILRTRHGFVLKGHVFRSFSTERLALCYSACNTLPACQSLNFNLAERICEFNSEFSRSRPDSFEESDVHVYADNPDRAKKGSTAISPGQSCKDIKDSGDFETSGNYWIRPAGSRDSFQGYCDMSAVGQWKNVPQSWISNTLKGGVSLTYSGGNSGLIISAQVTSYGCGSSIPSGALTLIKGYWTRIKYTQEFRGKASCWSIFGDNKKGHTSVNSQPLGLHPFKVSEGDLITNQFYMGGNSHTFDGKTTRCHHESSNFWYNTKSSVKYATVELRRNLTSEKAGIFTGTSCSTPTYKIKDIFVYF